ncbi:hypothetical protein [Quadrisphaera sp. DSM 44207]|uniref:hypothetical protein n=1 Tax=Quadrisphaera sp. DSM 44207 TaxID=1881057 RepID=UPI00115FEC69|nr:hypothetical protein [Quadrisphaera sp. DSM 44207]
MENRPEVQATWACAPPAPVVVHFDPGSGVDPQQLPLVAEPVVRGSVDLVLGHRRPGTRPPGARVLRALAGARLRQRTGTALPDPAVPAWAGRREALASLGAGRAPGSARGAQTGLTALAAAAGAGWRVAEVPLRCLPDRRPRWSGTLATARSALAARRTLPR